VVVLYVTDGRGSRAVGLSPDQMAARREREARTAAERLGVELEWMALPELDWEIVTLTRAVRVILERLQPDIIYTPSPIDYHPEHRKVARALAAALAPRSANRSIRIYEVQVPLTPLLINLLVPSGFFVRQRRAALAAYETQEQAIRPLERLRRYNQAYWREEVECFWELSVRQYRDLVESRDNIESTSPFRGLRQRPISDPLCYLRGWRKRRQLAKMVRRCGVPEGT
jgi:LmbE family N-acetylglucosaminyl deacetylase